MNERLVAVCCSVLQFVAVCCRGVTCCSVLQCVALCCRGETCSSLIWETNIISKIWEISKVWEISKIWEINQSLLPYREGVEERLILKNIISEMNKSLFYPWVSHIMRWDGYHIKDMRVESVSNTISEMNQCHIRDEEVILISCRNEWLDIISEMKNSC